MSGIVAAAVLAALAQAGEEVAERLKTERLTLDLDGADLADAVRVIGEVVGVSIYIAPNTLDNLLEVDRSVTVRARGITARSLLRLLLKPRGLTLTVREGIVMVVREDDLASAIVTRVYDVRDLTVRIEDFPIPTPEWGILEGYGGGRGGGTRGGALLARQMLTELWAPATAGTEMDAMRLSELIRAHTGGDSWTTNPAVGIQEVRGILIIAQTQKAHEEVKQLLDGLRQMR